MALTNEQKQQEADIAKRSEELDRREAALDARERNAKEADNEYKTKDRDLANREAALNTRARALDAREGEVNLRARDLDTDRENERLELPDGIGVAVIQLDRDVIAALAILHPAEQVAVASRVNGVVRQALIETRKLIPSMHPAAGDSDIAYAELIPDRIRPRTDTE